MPLRSNQRTRTATTTQLEIAQFESKSRLQADFRQFRELQTEGTVQGPPKAKQTLQQRLKALEEELNRHLAGEYGISSQSSTSEGEQERRGPLRQVGEIAPAVPLVHSLLRCHEKRRIRCYHRKSAVHRIS